MDWMQLIEIMSSIALVVVTVGLLVSTNMYRKATEKMARLQEKNADYLKKDNALKLMERWDNPALLEARDFTRDIEERAPELSKTNLLKEIEGEEATEGLKESLIHVFNFWERVRLSITYDRADEDILKETFRPVFISMYERFEVWLNEKSKQYPRYKEDLEKLYNRWKFTSSQ